jgi:hypothetical protein
MKKIALLLFIVFASVQLAPAVMAIFIETTSVFVADEEKENSKENNGDNKEKKDIAIFFVHSAKLTLALNLAIQLAEKIQPSPCLEQLTPPPNFC